jgi:hypothetical protein
MVQWLEANPNENVYVCVTADPANAGNSLYADIVNTSGSRVSGPVTLNRVANTWAYCGTIRAPGRPGMYVIRIWKGTQSSIQWYVANYLLLVRQDTVRWLLKDIQKWVKVRAC